MQYDMVNVAGSGDWSLCRCRGSCCRRCLLDLNQDRVSNEACHEQWFFRCFGGGSCGRRYFFLFRWTIRRVTSIIGVVLIVRIGGKE